MFMMQEDCIVYLHHWEIWRPHVVIIKVLIVFLNARFDRFTNPFVLGVLAAPWRSFFFGGGGGGWGCQKLQKYF